MPRKRASMKMSIAIFVLLFCGRERCSTDRAIITLLAGVNIHGMNYNYL